MVQLQMHESNKCGGIVNTPVLTLLKGIFGFHLKDTYILILKIQSAVCGNMS